MSLSALVWKDLRREARGKEGLQAGLTIVLLFVVVDVLSFRDLGGDAVTAAAVLWIPLLYGSAALVGRGFASEADRGTLDLLRAAPVPVALHGWSRTLVHGALLLALAGLGQAATMLLFSIPWSAAAALALALGAAGLAVVGTVGSALAASARSREILLPVLLVPVAVPILQAGLAATRLGLAGAPLQAAGTPLLLMASYDAVAAGMAWFLWPIVLEGD